MAGIRGLFWWAFLTLDRRIRSRRLQFRQSHNPDSSMPNHFQGVLKSNKLPIKFRLDCGQWSRNLRSLKLDAGTYVDSIDWFPGYSWCCWATYHLAFNNRLTTAVGQVSFGWWSIPRSIVAMRLHREGDSWIVGHCWFRGDPTDEVILSLATE